MHAHRLTWHRAMGLEAGTRSEGSRKQKRPLLEVHRLPVMVALSPEPDTICATSNTRGISAEKTHAQDDNLHHALVCSASPSQTCIQVN